MSSQLFSFEIVHGATPETYDSSYTGGTNAGDVNGTPDFASGTRGGRRAQTADTSIQGGRHGGAGYGHHGGSKTDQSEKRPVTHNEATPQKLSEANDRIVYTKRCDDAKKKLQQKNAQNATGAQSGR
ncbi:hypothetical protein BDP81DRAFT_390046 [Colletotrichum phormii]|uniref:Uncharacterized protein n=1 Tax=Colletotrichum phormii TaxID=359342 RepID=A0AAJ0EMY1_9PEZI|nr:uncharacterized protein BDP81DRAFT_390046 [Colletotrichum phormii]KAK1655054.1 hypothetical protein BDP81DRAFT_390046 [Colletotrichum phormii]